MIKNEFAIGQIAPYLCIVNDANEWTMKQKKYFLIPLFFCIWMTSSLQAQILYPGDVNNNGVVNGVDVLYWGRALEATGPAREMATTDFIAQIYDPWITIFPNGVNNAHADTNGDGLVNIDDVEDGIEPNWWKISPIIGQEDAYSEEGSGTIDPYFRGHTSTPIAEPDDGNLNMIYEIGTIDVPVSNFYGITYTIHYNTDYIVSAGGFTPISSGNGVGDNWETSFHHDPAAGKIQVAVVKMDNTPGNGFGEFGSFEFILIKDVVDAIALDTVMSVDSVLWTGPDLVPRPVVLDTVEMVDTTDNLTRIFNTNKEAIEVTVMPNPSDGNLTINSNKAPIWDVELYDLVGKRVPFTNTIYTLKKQGLRIDRTGLFVLKIRTSEGISTQKVYIHR